jgi:hypothetical protein
MKATPLTLLLVLQLLLTGACEKKDPAAANPLLGSWEYTGQVMTCPDPLNNFSEVCDTNCDVLTITSAGTYTYGKPGGVMDTGTYTISGNTVVFTESPTDITTRTYLISGTTLTLTEIDDTSGCTEVYSLQKL